MPPGNFIFFGSASIGSPKFALPFCKQLQQFLPPPQVAQAYKMRFHKYANMFMLCNGQDMRICQGVCLWQLFKPRQILPFCPLCNIFAYLQRLIWKLGHPVLPLECLHTRTLLLNSKLESNVIMISRNKHPTIINDYLPQ